MKLTTEYNGVQKSVQSTNGYHILETPEAFEILSKGIYSDQTAAVIRELGTNAADAHTAAGKPDEPFEVHLPNRLEPYFYVRDNGTGLSHEDILELYTTYFGTNRNTSNDYTGCLGLGSKSPFTYTDQFGVESRHNGVKRSYTCYMDEGKPAVSLLSEEPTDEPNGLEVRFPVAAYDFREFESKARTIYSRFRIRPRVTGAHDFTFEEQNYMLVKDNYGLCKERRGESYVVMGNVAYRLATYDISGSALTELERDIIEHGVDFFIPLGGVKIAASREKLSYTTATIATVKQHLQVVVDDVRKEATEFVSRAKTLWEARMMLQERKKGVLAKLMPKEVTWNSIVVSDTVNVNHYQNSPEICVITRGGYRRRSGSRTYNKSTTDTVLAERGRVFILQDLDRGTFSRAEYYMSCHPEVEKVYVLCPIKESLPPPAPVGQANGQLPLPKAPDNRPDFFKESGIAEVLVPVSSLPEPPRNTKPRVKREYAKVMELLPDLSSDMKANECWLNSDIDLEEGGIYVEVSHYRGLRPGYDPYDPQRLLPAVAALEQMGVKITLYGIRPSDVPRVAKRGNWINFWDYLAQQVNSNRHYQPVIDLANNWTNLHNRESISSFFGVPFAEGSLFRSFLERAEECRDAYECKKAQGWRKLASFLGENVNGTDNSKFDSLNKFRIRTFKKYPLTEHFSWGYSASPDFVSAVSEYIRLMDKQREQEAAEQEEAA